MDKEIRAKRAESGNDVIRKLIKEEQANEAHYDRPFGSSPRDRILGRRRLLAIFIHGLGSDKHAWGKFPNLIARDTDLSYFCDIDEFSYPTSLRTGIFAKIPRIELIAEGLASSIEHTHQKHFEVTLVCHSLGGLVARHYIVHMLKHQKKCRVKHLYLYATPNNGAELAKFGSRFLPWNPHVRALGPKSEFIRRLNEDWNIFKANQHVKVTHVIGGRDRIVSEESAKSYWGNDNCEVVADKDHFSIIKPDQRDDLSYSILKNGLIRSWNEVTLRE